MKRPIIIIGMILVAVAVLLHLKNRPQLPLLPVTTQEANQASPQPMKTNSIVAHSNVSPVGPINTVETSGPTNIPLNAITATNLEQWKQVVKDLKQLNGSLNEQYWVMEKDKPDRSPNRNVGDSYVLTANDKAVPFKATFINISAKDESGEIIRLEMQTPNMDINEARDLGLNICEMLNLDPKDFLAWCGKVGNRSLGTELYHSKGFRDSEGKKIYGFQMLHTYDNEKPWCMNFVIQSP